MAGEGTKFTQKVARDAALAAMKKAYLQINKPTNNQSIWRIGCLNADHTKITLNDGTIWKAQVSGKPNECGPCVQISSDTYYMPGVEIPILQTDQSGGASYLVHVAFQSGSWVYFISKIGSSTLYQIPSPYPLLTGVPSSDFLRPQFFPSGQNLFFGFTNTDGNNGFIVSYVAFPNFVLKPSPTIGQPGTVTTGTPINGTFSIPVGLFPRAGVPIAPPFPTSLNSSGTSSCGCAFNPVTDAGSECCTSSSYTMNVLFEEETDSAILNIPNVPSIFVSGPEFVLSVDPRGTLVVDLYGDWHSNVSISTYYRPKSASITSSVNFVIWADLGTPLSNTCACSTTASYSWVYGSLAYPYTCGSEPSIGPCFAYDPLSSCAERVQTRSVTINESYSGGCTGSIVPGLLACDSFNPFGHVPCDIYQFGNFLIGPGGGGGDAYLPGTNPDLCLGMMQLQNTNEVGGLYSFEDIMNSPVSTIVQGFTYTNEMTLSNGTETNSVTSTCGPESSAWTYSWTMDDLITNQQYTLTGKLPEAILDGFKSKLQNSAALAEYFNPPTYLQETQYTVFSGTKLTPLTPPASTREYYWLQPYTSNSALLTVQPNCVTDKVVIYPLDLSNLDITGTFKPVDSLLFQNLVEDTSTHAIATKYAYNIQTGLQKGQVIQGVTPNTVTYIVEDFIIK